MQEGVVLLVRLDAVIKGFNRPGAYGVEKRPARALGCLRTHQNAKFLQSLPFPIQGKERADLEEPRRYIEGPRNAGPFFKVTQSCPACYAVVHDEEAPACRVGAHSILPAGAC